MINKEENYIGLGENLVDCLSCQEKISETDFYAKYRICPFCNFHYSVDFSKRLEIISDQGSFVEFNKNITVRKPKNLRLNQNYKKNVKTTRERTGLEEAVITGTCNIGGIKSVIILLDFGFLGGSMGIIVGEKVSKAFSYSRKNSLPVLSVISSGGRRVQEGVFSLIQMIKTTNATDELNDKKLPHVSILTNPSGGQVYSSFAISADIKIAEPGAIIGMFSRNEIAKTSIDNEGIDLTSENFFENGLIDNIISRNNLKKEISSILESLTSNNKIPKKVDLELPEIEFVKSNQTKKIEKSRPSAKQYLNIIFDDVISLKDNNEKNLSTLGIAKLGPQSVIYLIQNFQRINKSNDGKLNINDFERIKDAIKLSKKFKLPTIFFVDNKGINNTFKNEISGIANLLSENIKLLSNHEEPLISIITGETTSEGSLPYFISDSVLMLEYSILNTGLDSAGKDILSAYDCLETGIIDKIIQEPPLGASKGLEDMSRLIKISLINQLSILNYTSKRKLVKSRIKKFQAIDMSHKKLTESVSNEIKIWRNVLRAGYKALRS
tara:strand:+ start:4176 stop:5831 length:1656 start_codon:yes stop_codon:yes gene_type:complete